jgi:hypothetical protein
MLKTLVALSLLSIATAPAAAGEPGEAVRFFYVDPGAVYQPENRVLFTGPALDFLNAADAAWDRDETVCIDFGFAVDAQDYDDAEILRTLKLDETVSGDTASVTAHFDNFGQPTRIEWTLQKNAGNWLVSDIASEANQWRVSSMICE